jgi:hypothetical protein
MVNTEMRMNEPFPHSIGRPEFHTIYYYIYDARRGGVRSGTPRRAWMKVTSAQLAATRHVPGVTKAAAP